MSQQPFLPFSKPTIDEATIAAVGDVLRSGWITSGPKVQAFEAQLSEYVGGRPVRTFNSGTCTMEIALRIAGIGAGDEVITTPISWVATANVILEVGATPVFADIDPITRNIDLKKAEAGRIINIAAGAASKASLGMGAYAAAKSGVMRLTEALAEELKDQRITVNAIMPSIIDTPQNRLDMPDADATRWVTPEQVANVIVFLASQEASAITGAAIAVNGRC